ncbi:hypothetical protein N2152v2_011303 [Parachlorella kessleri]
MVWWLLARRIRKKKEEKARAGATDPLNNEAHERGPVRQVVHEVVHEVLYVADPACLAALVGQPLMAAAHTLLREQTAMGEALQVNAKQHRAILRRREKRQREYEKGQLLHSRKPYRNRLVHDFASSRPRNEKGHFVATAIAAAAAAGSQPPTGPAVPAPALASLAVAEGEGVAAEGGLGADSRPEEDTVVEDGVLGAAAAAAAGVALVTGDDALAAEALACLPQVQQQQQQGGIGNLPADLHGQQGAGEGQQQQ